MRASKGRADRSGRLGRLARVAAAAGLLVAILVPVALAADRTITISSFAFPATTSVNVGDTVTWRNESGATHNATADDGSFASGSIADGGSRSVTFASAGSFPYHCTIHPSMTGTIVVSAAGSAPATDTAPPPAPVHDDVDSAAIVLALLGLTMLGGTFVADRRFARDRDA